MSQTSVLLSHTLQFALLLAMCTNLTQHAAYVCLRRVPPLHTGQFGRLGPVFVITLATALIMVQPTYLVLRVAKQVQSMHSVWGHVMHACSAVGFTLLLGGMLWANGAFAKLQGGKANSENDKHA